MRTTRDIQTKEIFNLAGGNQNRCACGKADDDGMGNKIDQCAKASQPHGKLEQSSQKSQRQHQADKLWRAGLCQRANGREHNNRNGRGGAGNQMPAGAEQRGDDGWYHCRVQAILRRQARDGGKCHRLRQYDDCAGKTCQCVEFEAALVDLRPPAQKRQQFVKPKRAGVRLHKEL